MNICEGLWLNAVLGYDEFFGLCRGNKMKYPYAQNGRLADVMALIQVLSLDNLAHRGESGLNDELQGPPKSADTWEEIAEQHPEFFRTKDEGTHKVSLVARHVQQQNSDGKRDTLKSDFVGKLLEAAIELHDREMARKNHWNVHIPIIAVVAAGVFSILGVFLGAYLKS